MFNINSGYIGSSRSVRSQESLDTYEVPITIINKALIEDFLDEQDDFTKDDLGFLSKVSVAKWKYVASERMSYSSWHHTSSYFNETRHYSLYSISEMLLEIKETLDVDYKEYRDSKKKDVSDVKYGVIKVQVWGGTRKHPKITGYDEVAGIIIGDWLYYKDGHRLKGFVKKYKITANKVEWLDKYDSYIDLVKNYKNYKSSKKVFNKLIKEKGE